LFVIEYLPDPSVQRGHTVVVVPAFAEEMNRSRRMVALQAQQLAENGLRVVVFDFFGTGDSEGEFGDARWEGWVEDLRTIAAWSRAGRDQRVSLLAIRLGALVAVDACAAADDDFQCVFWQPCTSGKVYLRQFLRLRMAEKLINNKADAESASALLARLTEGESLEIAGYELAGPLALAIQSRTFDGAPPQGMPALRWLDLVAAEGDPLSPATAATVDRWAAAGMPVQAEAVPGDPFWSLQEITIAPRLIQATTRVLLAG
jgi:exosortase A-associated hydrolase 2